jgi:predicted DNA-binding transcriptional regulator YafY
VSPKRDIVRDMAKNHIERILHIDKLLREDTYPSRKAIAETFEVSVKTIERDLEYMRDRLGAPLEYDRERRGFYYEEPGFYLPALFMSEGDALALFLSHHIGSAWRGTPLAETAQTAWEQLSRLLPKEVSISPAVFSEYVVLIDRSVSYTAEHWLTLLRCAQAKRKVTVEYKTPGHSAGVERTLHPYRLIHHKDAWYLLAFDEFRKEVRIYALSRIQSATETTVPFKIPDHFQLADYIDPNFGIFTEAEWFTVRIRAAAWMADILAEHLGDGSFQRDDVEDGKVQISWRTNQHEELKHWVLQWGEHVEVMEPESIREEIGKIGTYYVDAYGR